MNKRTSSSESNIALGCYLVFLGIMLALMIAFYGTIFWLIKYAIDAFS